jgi:monoamine oxidase
MKTSVGLFRSGHKTYRIVDMTEKVIQIKTFFAPLGKEMYFAGEHISVLMDAPGTMEAACESGNRVASMIAKALNQPKSIASLDVMV